MNNNIKIENIKNEPLTTEQKEFLVSGLFSMISKEDNQFVSKEKYDKLQNKINKVIDKINYYMKKNTADSAYSSYIQYNELLKILNESEGE